MREAAIAVGMAGARLGQRVIIGARHVDARLPRYQIGARAGDRQHLHRDAAGVHVRQPSVAQIGKLVALGGLCPDEVRAGKAAACDRFGGYAGNDARHRVVLFQGDDAHVVSPRVRGQEGRTLQVGALRGAGLVQHQPATVSGRSLARAALRAASVPVSKFK